MANRKNAWAITIAPRFLTSIIKENAYPLGCDVWNDTYITLPEGSPSLWKDAITAQIIKSEQTLAIGDVLKYFPAALLISGGRKANKQRMIPASRGTLASNTLPSIPRASIALSSVLLLVSLLISVRLVLAESDQSPALAEADQSPGPG